MDAAALADALIPRLRRWTGESWTLPATPTTQPVLPPPGTAPRGYPAPRGHPAPRGCPAPPAAAPPDGAAVRTPAPAAGDVVTRAEFAARVAQRIADVTADAEGQPRRTVPRLSDLVLADQLAVLVDDALRTGSPAAETAVTRELTALRTALGYA